MDANFWHQKWERGDIGFNQAQVNPFLAHYFGLLGLAPGSRIFLPLCGKTIDFEWLLGNGYRVAGAELSELAIRELFDSLRLTPEIVNEGELVRYSAPNIDIFVGDFFALSAEQLGVVDAVYDRAALVALPAGTRNPYVSTLMEITHQAPQLLISYEYDQSRVDGPPFSVPDAEIQQHYGGAFNIRALERQDVQGGMKGKTPASETCWLLAALSMRET